MRSPTHATDALARDWYDTALGAFVLPLERRLVQKMFAPWPQRGPQRGRRLLEVGCGSGRFLDIFWEAGFDVTGYDHDPAQLETARARLGGRVDTRLGVPDTLPFEDNTFDFVAVGPFALCDNTFEVIHEAVRVAALGVLLRWWNPYSWAGMGKTLYTLLPDTCVALSWRSACAAFREYSPQCSLTTRSVLHGPLSMWGMGLCAPLNNALISLASGALLALRMTSAPSTPMTGMPLRVSPVRMKNAQATAAES